jgi:hypothetical protein
VVERRGHVGWLLFSRPERRNAMNNAMRDEHARGRGVRTLAGTAKLEGWQPDQISRSRLRRPPALN